MRIGKNEDFLLTYCTNIHPGNGWAQVFSNLSRFAPALKARFSPERPFGIGLRLSNAESQELLQGNRLKEFQNFLETNGFFVFTLNGFPYGVFHQAPIKARVYAPDWQHEERLQYTLRLIEILAALLPRGGEGSISTCPLSYKPWVDQKDSATWERFTRNVVRTVEKLIRVRREQGRFIHLNFEPEPDGLLENSEEVVRFYENWLIPAGTRMLVEALAISPAKARQYLLDHLRICYDTCHMAVAFENPATALSRFEAVGIKVGKVQVSSALKIFFPDKAPTRKLLARTLEPFAESTYLHQVVQRNRDETFCQYPDLVDALPHIQEDKISQWRIHFHVPIFLDSLEKFDSTQKETKEVLALLKKRQFSHHLEIETYTWEVLPPAFKTNLLDSIAREYAWTLKQFA